MGDSSLFHSNKIKNKAKFFLTIPILFLIGACKLPNSDSIRFDKDNNVNKINTINIEKLLNNLLIADRKLTPVLKYTGNGQQYYNYPQFPGGEKTYFR